VLGTRSANSEWPIERKWTKLLTAPRMRFRSVGERVGKSYPWRPWRTNGKAVGNRRFKAFPGSGLRGTREGELCGDLFRAPSGQRYLPPLTFLPHCSVNPERPVTPGALSPEALFRGSAFRPRQSDGGLAGNRSRRSAQRISRLPEFQSPVSLSCAASCSTYPAAAARGISEAR
jgi:hypothetical protein